MFYALITLLLLAGSYILELRRDVVIVVVGAWTIVSLVMRLLEVHFDRLKRRTEEAGTAPENGSHGDPVAPPVPGHGQFYKLTANLYKIYNEELLLETFSSNLKKLFDPVFCFLYLPGEDSPSLRVDVKSGTVGEGLLNRRIDSKSAIFDFLVRRPNAYLVNDLLEMAGDDADLEFLRQQGTEIIVPLTISEKGIGLVGLSARRGSEAPYTARDLEMAFALCRTVEIVLENIQQFKKIEELSYTDSMTRLYNYRYFYKRLNEEIRRAKRFNRYLALAIFDLDDFKVFNDSYGHQTGDYLLRQLGELLVDSVRTIDIVCRYGGEEFCVIMPESDAASCSGFMERLRLKVADHKFRNRFRNERHTITVSAGGGIFPTHARRPDRLIYCADMALLESKKAGKNTSRMFDHSQIDPNAEESD